MRLEDRAGIQAALRSRMLSNTKHRQTDTGKPFQIYVSYQLPKKPHPFCVSMKKSACHSK